MNKLIITLCVVGFSFDVDAQLKINEDGYISINSTETPLSPISINYGGKSDSYLSAKTNINGFAWDMENGLTTNWGIVANISNRSINHNFIIGVQGDVRDPSGTDRNKSRSYGVLGSAGNATSGWNYGVFGRLRGEHYGAGVYGTAEELENGVYIDGKYAGYFNGNTKVVGTLKVTGTINGTIIGAAATSTTSNAGVATIAAYSDEDTETTVDKLQGLSALTYYKAQPAAMASATMAHIGDTAIVEQALTQMETQDLSKMHYALSAEQLQTVYPDLVYDNEDGTKGINYMEMIPLLVQAISELNAKIAILESGNTAVVQKAAETTTVADTKAGVMAKLGQNTPNPFTANTQIDVTIPTTAKNAMICIYDMKGNQLKQVEISERGRQTITINNGELSAGLYLYSLIVDNKLVDTKRMVLANK